MKSRLLLIGSAFAGLVLSGLTGALSDRGAAANVGSTSTVQLIRALPNMSALRAPARERDRATASSIREAAMVLTDAAGAPNPMMTPGAAQLDTTRTLLSGIGADDQTIYAYRTTKGRVCGGLSGGPSGCFEGFPVDAPAIFTIGDADDAGPAPLVIYGFIPDEVTAVTINIGTARVPAEAASNAFYAEFPLGTAARDIDQLVLTLSGGEQRTVELSVRAD